MSEFVSVQEEQGGVRIIRLDRPPMNALSNQLAAAPRCINRQVVWRQQQRAADSGTLAHAIGSSTMLRCADDSPKVSLSWSTT